MNLFENKLVVEVAVAVSNKVVFDVVQAACKIGWAEHTTDLMGLDFQQLKNKLVKLYCAVATWKVYVILGGDARAVVLAVIHNALAIGSKQPLPRMTNDSKLEICWVFEGGLCFLFVFLGKNVLGAACIE